jgi:phage tail sheath protein FI
MTYLRPGVYVEETLNPVRSVVGPNSATVAAFVGESFRGPTVPTLISSWSEFTKFYGTYTENTSNLGLITAVNLFFQNGGSQCYVRRVIGTGAVTATRTLNDRAGTPDETLTLNARNAGAWGNGINVTVTNSNVTGYFDLTVYYGGVDNGNIVERYTDLTMTYPDARYAVSLINGSSRFITAVDAASSSTGATKNPALVTNQALSTGANGSAITDGSFLDGFESFDTVETSLLFNAPGVTTAAAVNPLIQYCEERKDAFLVIDGINDSVANQLTRASSYTPSSYAAVYYPNIVIPDPIITNAALPVGAGAAVVGVYSSTDASRGVFKAPAGLNARIAGATSVASLTNAQLDSLNSAAAPVNAIRFIPGNGIVVMGAKTLKPGYADKYVPVRRTLIYLSKALTDLTKFAIFEPNDSRLWRQITNTCSAFLTEFWSQGGLAGSAPDLAYFVKCDGETNTQGSIDNGEVNIEVGVALQRPAEFVIIKIGQYDGGTTVTTA